MGQFGVKMNLIRIIQVSGIIFLLKSISIITYLIPLFSGSRALLQKTQGLICQFAQTRSYLRVDGELIV
jgi:hypothetical protein